MNEPTRRALEILGMIGGGCAAAAGILFACAALYDASHSSPSGEWAGLGLLFTYVIEWLVAIVTAAAAITQLKPKRRIFFAAITVVLLLVPFAANYLHYRRPIDPERVRRIERQTKAVMDEEARRGTAK